MLQLVFFFFKSFVRDNFIQTNATGVALIVSSSHHSRRPSIADGFSCVFLNEKKNASLARVPLWPKRQRKLQDLLRWRWIAQPTQKKTKINSFRSIQSDGWDDCVCHCFAAALTTDDDIQHINQQLYLEQSAHVRNVYISLFLVNDIIDCAMSGARRGAAQTR